jgi:DNA polymerase
VSADIPAVLEAIAQEVRTCIDCELCRGRTHAVPGAGSSYARVMLIGEGPGFNEDKVGLPFVGQAGKLLTDLLDQAGLTREDVFITNVVKCRPPGNRDPLPDEIAACSQYLDRQIEIINPDVIVTLGRFSMSRWFKGERISQIHGKPRTFNNRLIVPMYHPAAALHQRAILPDIQADFRELPVHLAKVAEARAKRDQGEREPDPVQTTLF